VCPTQHSTLVGGASVRCRAPPPGRPARTDAPPASALGISGLPRFLQAKFVWKFLLLNWEVGLAHYVCHASNTASQRVRFAYPFAFPHTFFTLVNIYTTHRSRKTTRWNGILWLEYLTRSSAIAEGPRDASCQLKSCQLPRNTAETTSTTSPEQIEVMKLEGYSGPMWNKHVHSIGLPPVPDFPGCPGFVPCCPASRQDQSRDAKCPGFQGKVEAT